MATLRILLLSLFFITPLFYGVLVVHAQDALVASTTLADAETAWYSVEKIEGDIAVGDFVVGPGRVELEVLPGQTITQEIIVTNRISEGRTFHLEVDDIKGSADGSSAVSLADGERGPYSIRDYISFPKDSFTLNLGERARIPVTITIPQNAEPGGFYGSVLVSTDRTPTEANGNVSRSPVVARVGSLFFVTVQGEVERSGIVKSITTIGDKWWYEEGPISLAILYENTGSVHLNPYGEVSVKNMFNEEVGFIELEPWFVLPQSLRNREITWDRELLLGRYTVTARINRGYDNVVDEVTTSFWVLPWKVLVGTFVGLFVIVFGLRTFFRTFEFSRRKT